MLLEIGQGRRVVVVVAQDVEPDGRVYCGDVCSSLSTRVLPGAGTPNS